MLGLATVCLLSVLIVSECYPASDEKLTKIRCGLLVHGVATSVKSKQTKERMNKDTKSTESVGTNKATHKLISKERKYHGNRKEFPATDQQPPKQ